MTASLTTKRTWITTKDYMAKPQTTFAQWPLNVRNAIMRYTSLILCVTYS
jgi:hypothetical protein